MLFLKRNKGEVVVLKLPNGDVLDIFVSKVNVFNGKANVTLGFEAPEEVEILREELLFKCRVKENGA